jgi:hypothetical protein
MYAPVKAVTNRPSIVDSCVAAAGNARSDRMFDSMKRTCAPLGKVELECGHQSGRALTYPIDPLDAAFSNRPAVASKVHRAR